MKGVFPADHVAGRPPPRPERVRIRNVHGGKPAVAALSAHLKLVKSFEIEGDGGLAAVDLELEAVAMPKGEPCRLDRPDCAILKPDRFLDCVVHLASGDERRRHRGDGDYFTDEEAREVDDVCR